MLLSLGFGLFISAFLLPFPRPESPPIFPFSDFVGVPFVPGFGGKVTRHKLLRFLVFERQHSSPAAVPPPPCYSLPLPCCCRSFVPFGTKGGKNPEFIPPNREPPNMRSAPSYVDFPLCLLSSESIPSIPNYFPLFSLAPFSCLMLPT